jgi:hypothetical protein
VELGTLHIYRRGSYRPKRRSYTHKFVQLVQLVQVVDWRIGGLGSPKGLTDDGKRFYSGGRCMGQPEALLLFNVGGSLRGGMARGRTGAEAGGFFPNSCFTCMGVHF